MIGVAGLFSGSLFVGCAPAATRGAAAESARSSAAEAPAGEASTAHSSDLNDSDVADAHRDLRDGDAASSDTDHPQEDRDDDVLADDVAESDLHRGDVASVQPRRPHPLAGVSEAEILRRLQERPEQLGAMTLGAPNSGHLFNGVRLPTDAHWHLQDPGNAWGTQETVDYLVAAMKVVFAEYPDAHQLYVGHLSAQRGGALSPHKSHRTGSDVDISYFYSAQPKWYARATAQNLDLAKTWAFVRALVTETDVKFILIDASIQSLLREYAAGIGEDPQWLEDLFRGTPGKTSPLIRHVPGHATHIHVRFFNPIAQETGRLCYAAMLKLGLTQPVLSYDTYKVKKGDTLGKLSKRFGVSVPAIRQANGLRSNLIKAGRVYRIPRATTALPPDGPVPLRRIPPARSRERLDKLSRLR